MSKPKKTLEERFWEKVKLAGPDECWEWQGCRCDGYGMIKVGKVNQRAHRLSFIWAGGQLREGDLVCHECDNPPCVNPKHLGVGDHSKNLKDAYDRGLKVFHGKGVIVKGFDNIKAKLSRQAIKEIRNDLRTYKEIAADFSIAPSTVCRVKKRHSWDDVE